MRVTWGSLPSGGLILPGPNSEGRKASGQDLRGFKLAALSWILILHWEQREARTARSRPSRCEVDSTQSPYLPFSPRFCPSAPQLLAQALPLPLLSPPQFPACSPSSSWSPLPPLHPQAQPLLVLAVFRNTSWSPFPQQGKTKEAPLLILLQSLLHLPHHPHLGAVPSVGGSRTLETALLQLQGLQRLMAPSLLDLAPLNLLCDNDNVISADLLFCGVLNAQRMREAGGSSRLFPPVTFFLDTVQ